jgi:hypothetical protein
MPGPAGGGPEPLALFTLAELDAWAQTTIDPGTGALVLELVTTAIRGIIGADRYDALTDLAPLKLVALDVARRMIRNADGRRSTAHQIDDYSETVTYASETLQPPSLTDADIDAIWVALGVRRGGAFTIRPAVPVAARSWC